MRHAHAARNPFAGAAGLALGPAEPGPAAGEEEAGLDLAAGAPRRGWGGHVGEGRRRGADIGGGGRMGAVQPDAACSRRRHRGGRGEGVEKRKGDF